MEGSPTTGIIALVPDQWTDIDSVRHHVLRRLARYCKVVWVEPARHWREFLDPRSPDFLAGDRWSAPLPSLSVLKTGWTHPAFYRHAGLARASLRSRLAVARKHLLAQGATRIAVYVWRDEFADAIELVEHDFSCYHVDDEYTFSDEEQPNSPREVNLLRGVDQVIVHSHALLEKKGGINPKTALIPNGVDYRLFSTPHAAPADIAAVPHPRIGYAGVIKKQLDFDLINRLARQRPDWSFVFVGPVVNVEGEEQQLEALRRLPNVHFLGGKAADELPAYIQQFDVCLMCYKVNDYTRYINPLKLHEYLACGRPIVSAPIGIVPRYTQVVTIATSDQEWLAAVERSLGEEESGEPAAARRRAVAGTSDWDALVAQIATLFVSKTAAEKDRHHEPGAKLLAKEST